MPVSSPRVLPSRTEKTKRTVVAQVISSVSTSTTSGVFPRANRPTRSPSTSVSVSRSRKASSLRSSLGASSSLPIFLRDSPVTGRSADPAFHDSDATSTSTSSPPSRTASSSTTNSSRATGTSVACASKTSKSLPPLSPVSPSPHSGADEPPRAASSSPPPVTTTSRLRSSPRRWPKSRQSRPVGRPNPLSFLFLFSRNGLKRRQLVPRARG